MSVSLAAQSGEQSAPALTYEQLVKAAKVYFRDTAEFPMMQDMTFTVLDRSGRVRQTRKQLVEYLFNGYNSGKQTASGHVSGEVGFWAALRGAKMVKASLNSAFWIMAPGLEVYSPTDMYDLEMNEHHEDKELITGKLNRVKACPPFTMKENTEMYVPDHPGCNNSEFQLHTEDLSFQRFSFDVIGLPASVRLHPLGDCTLQRYHAEVEFQKIILPGDKDPLLVPKQVTAILETDKGKIVISSVYER
ncbi:MAG TPA: hypothetical protein VJA94_09225, partial [Candidatus Angelobacter sp.]